MTTQSHESLTSFRKVAASSDRKFGITVGAILVALAIWPVVRHHAPVRWWLLVPGASLVVLGLAAPKILAPLNLLWARLGLSLARVTNPVVMGVMFFVAVVPIAWLVRLRGKDLLRLRREAAADTYWIERREPATALKNQF